MATISPTEPGLDLVACDREPIHIPGSIQPHGLLLVAEAESGRIVAGAGDIEGRLATDWLGRDAGALIGRDLTGDPRRHAPIDTGAERFDVAVHRSGDHVIVELEPSAGMPSSAGEVLAFLDAAATGFERAVDLPALCDRAAASFRALTGFDRVMIYRFLDDDAGQVIAEDRAPELGTFLHHRFPASDIPRQARALYVRNRTRAIPTIDYRPAPLRPAGFETTDLSDVGLRSVSPIHLTYLRNMGVAASASISIVKDGLLWGLIACHHDSPRHLPADVRAAAATLASGLARQIRAKEEAQAYRERLRLSALGDSIVPRIATTGNLRSAIGTIGDDLRAMFDADGFAFVKGSAVDCFGTCPTLPDILDLARWTMARGGTDPFATHCLSKTMPDAEAYLASASGLLTLPLADENAVLLWFRAEQVEEVEWAGNPHKAATLSPGETLSPRHSFASWAQIVRGQSRRWTLEEVDAAHRLRRTLHDAHQNQRLRTLNRDLQRTVLEKDAVIAQKDMMMKEVDHRIQNSLQLVSAFLSLQARASDHAVVKDNLAEAQARLSAVALVHRRLYRDDQIETIDLARYLEELAGDMKTSLGTEWGSQMRLDLAPVLIPTDRAVNVGLIMTELVINATKYAYAGRPGPIAIALEQHRARFRLIVADQGRGQIGTGVGFGSRMMAAMITKLDGVIAHDDNQPGLRAIVTAPIEDVR